MQGHLERRLDLHGSCDHGIVRIQHYAAKPCVTLVDGPAPAFENRAYGFPRQHPRVLCLQRRQGSGVELDHGMRTADFVAVRQAVEAGNAPLRAAFEHVDSETAEFLLDAFAVQVVMPWPMLRSEAGRGGILSRFACPEDTCLVFGV